MPRFSLVVALNFLACGRGFMAGPRSSPWQPTEAQLRLLGHLRLLVVLFALNAVAIYLRKRFERRW